MTVAALSNTPCVTFFSRALDAAQSAAPSRTPRNSTDSFHGPEAEASSRPSNAKELRERYILAVVDMSVAASNEPTGTPPCPFALLLVLCLASPLVAQGATDTTRPLEEPAAEVLRFGDLRVGSRCIARVGDVDGDNTPDIALTAIRGTREHDKLHEMRILLLSGSDLTAIRDIDARPLRTVFTGVLADAGDQDDDGVADLALSSSSNDQRDKVVIVSGDSGTPLFVIAKASSSDICGQGIVRLGDVDGDDVDDLLVGESGAGLGNHGAEWLGAADESWRLVRCVSGATGHTLYALEGGQQFGEEMLALDDVDGDEVLDVVLTRDGFPGAAYHLALLSGADGSELWDVEAAEGGLGGRLAHVRDLDGDHVDDVVFGCFNAPAGQRVVVYSGADGSRLMAIGGEPDDVRRFGRAVTTLPDVNGDGRDEIVVSLSRSPAKWTYYSEIRVYSGADGRLLSTLGPIDAGPFTAEPFLGLRTGDGRRAVASPGSSRRRTPRLHLVTTRADGNAVGVLGRDRYPGPLGSHPSA